MNLCRHHSIFPISEQLPEKRQINTMKERQSKLAPYIQALPGILQFQIFTKLFLGLWLFLMGRVFRLLLKSTGRVAVSTGDFVFLFTRWQRNVF